MKMSQQRGLLAASASKPATVRVPEVINGFKHDRFGLVNKPELAQPCSLRNLSVPDGNSRESPDVIVAAIAVLNDANAVRHDDTIVLAGRRAWDHDGILSFGQLHGHAKRDDLKLQRFEGCIFCGVKIDPLAVRRGKRVSVGIDNDFHTKTSLVNCFHLIRHNRFGHIAVKIARHLNRIFGTLAEVKSCSYKVHAGSDRNVVFHSIHKRFLDFKKTPLVSNNVIILNFGVSSEILFPFKKFDHVRKNISLSGRFWLVGLCKLPH
nr:MAG TPA: hypothetical protein [Caudoviricetes sp.]